MIRFNHENVIDIRDILRSTSLDSMKDVYIVQVESPQQFTDNCPAVSFLFISYLIQSGGLSENDELF